MGSYCHICGNFVNSLDDCDLPYGGAPAPNYDYYEPSSPTYEVPSYSDYFSESPPAYSTRSSTLSARARFLSQNISPLLNQIQNTEGLENKLAIVDRVYVFLKDNMDVLKKNIKLYDIAKQKLDEFTQGYPEASYLKVLRKQMFG